MATSKRRTSRKPAHPLFPFKSVLGKRRRTSKRKRRARRDPLTIAVGHLNSAYIQLAYSGREGASMTRAKDLISKTIGAISTARSRSKPRSRPR